MGPLANIRIELGIDARRIIQQVQLDNQIIEEHVVKGIELALKDFAEGDAFVQHIRQATKDELASIVNKQVLSWEFRSRVSKMLEEKISKKVEEYGDMIAERVTSSLKT